MWKEALTQKVGNSESDASDPYKAKREREKREGKKRRVEREGRKRRFEEMRGKRGDWRVGEVGRMMEGLEV